MAGRIGFALLGLVAAYFIAVAGYALVHADAYATDMPRLLRYVLGPLAISVVLFGAAAALTSETRLAVGLSAAAILVALFAFEAALTKRSFAGIQGLFGYLENPERAAPFKSALPPSYTLKALNLELGVTDTDRSLLGGMPGAEVLLCTQGGEPVSYRADRYGFRNRDSVYDKTTDLLILGDSFAEGICLREGTDIASQLRKEFPALVNTGTRGAGPLFQLAILRRWGPELRPPKTVLLFFEGNDWENLRTELQMPYLTPLLDAAASPGPTEPDPATLADAERLIARWWDEYGALDADPRRAWLRNFFALQQTSAILGLHYPKGFPDLPEFDQVLAAGRSLVEEWGGRLTVVYIPQIDRYVGLLPNARAYDGLRARVRAATETAGVGFVDLTEPFAAAGDPLSFYAADAHFSEAGARFAAKLIADAF